MLLRCCRRRHFQHEIERSRRLVDLVERAYHVQFFVGRIERERSTGAGMADQFRRLAEQCHPARQLETHQPVAVLHREE